MFRLPKVGSDYRDFTILTDFVIGLYVEMIMPKEVTRHLT